MSRLRRTAEKHVLSATSLFTFTARHSLDEVTTPLDGGDPSPPSTSVNGYSVDGYPLNYTIPGREPMAVSCTSSTPESSGFTGPVSHSANRLHQFPKEPIEGIALADDPMELAIDSEPPFSTMRKPIRFHLKPITHYLIEHEPTILGGNVDEEQSVLSILGGNLDEEQSVLSYADDPAHLPIASLSPSTKRSAPNGRRSPYVAISAGEHSLYQGRKRGPERALIGFLGAIDAQHLSESDNRIPDPPAGRDVPVSDQASDTRPFTDMQNESTGSAVPRNVPPNTGGVNSTGAALPTANVRGSSTPPHRRIRSRGVFIVGNGAPIKIDEGIEVHLRDGVEGQVDFVM